MIFFPLPDEQRWELAEQFSILDIPGGHSLLTEGKKADGLYIIAGGEAGTYKVHPDGEMSLLSHLGVGQFFGELFLVKDQEAMCSLITLEACTVLKLKAENFNEVMEKYPRVFDLLSAISEERYQELQAYDSLWYDAETSPSS